MILGLDASTSVVGLAIIDEQTGQIVYTDYLKLTGKATKKMIDKAAAVKEWLQKIKTKYQITKVYIEDYAIKFARGKSSASTITKLAAWNGICQWIAYDIFGLYTEALNVTEARKKLGIKTLSVKKCGIDVKEQVFDQVMKNYNLTWPTKVLSSGPRKGQTVYINEARDMTDAYVVAKAGFLGLVGDIK